MPDQEVKLGFKGLWPTPANSAAPPGGMLIADEVVIRRDGLVEPRPGFSAADEFGTLTSLRRMVDFQSSYFGVKLDTTQTKWTNGTAIKTEAATPAELSWTIDAIKGQEARKNLYITTSDTPRKICAPLDATAYPAGLPPLQIVTTSLVAPGGNFAVNTLVAYRAVLKRTDANGTVVRSAPSGNIDYFALVDRYPVISAMWGPNQNILTGDEIELYRTISFVPPTLGTPPSEYYFLAGVHRVTAAEQGTLGAAGEITFTDTKTDQELGAALYTNPDEQGAENANEPLPVATSMALFNGSLFLGDLTYQHHIDLTWLDGLAVLAGVSAGIGVRVVTGDLATGSPTILNVSNTTGLQVGMLVAGTAGVNWTNPFLPVHVLSIVGTTVTVSENYTGAPLVTTPLGFADAIKIETLNGSTSEYFAVDSVPYFLAALAVGRKNTSLINYAASPYRQTASSLVIGRSIGANIGVMGNDAGKTYTYSFSGETRSVRLTRKLGSEAGFRVSATHGNEYQPALPLISANTPQVSTQETIPAGLAWSKNLEPEHFSLLHTDQTGVERSRILALHAVKNALLVCTDQGLWRVSGAGANSGFRIDQRDRSVRILYSESAVALGDKVYIFSDRGVFECDENSTLPLTENPLASVLAPVQKAIGAGSRTAHGAWMVANRKDNEVLVGVPDPASVGGLTRTRWIYVFNRLTGTWVRWLFDSECGIYHNADALLRFQEAADTRTERATSDVGYGADRGYPITVTSFTGKTVTIAGGSGWSPIAGSGVTAIDAGPLAYLVTEVIDATHVVLDRVPPVGWNTQVGYDAFGSIILPIANTAKNPGMLKNWGEGNVWWSSLTGMRSYEISTYSSEALTDIGQTRVVSEERIASPEENGGHPADAEAFRFVVPRNHSKATRLYPQVTIFQALSRWALEGITIAYSFASGRVLRKR